MDGKTQNVRNSQVPDGLRKMSFQCQSVCVCARIANPGTFNRIRDWAKNHIKWTNKMHDMTIMWNFHHWALGELAAKPLSCTPLQEKFVLCWWFGRVTSCSKWNVLQTFICVWMSTWWPEAGLFQDQNFLKDQEFPVQPSWFFHDHLFDLPRPLISMFSPPTLLLLIRAKMRMGTSQCTPHVARRDCGIGVSSGHSVKSWGADGLLFHCVQLTVNRCAVHQLAFACLWWESRSARVMASSHARIGGQSEHRAKPVDASVAAGLTGKGAREHQCQMPLVGLCMTHKTRVHQWFIGGLDVNTSHWMINCWHSLTTVDTPNFNTRKNASGVRFTS